MLSDQENTSSSTNTFSTLTMESNSEEIDKLIHEEVIPNLVSITSNTQQLLNSLLLHPSLPSMLDQYSFDLFHPLINILYQSTNNEIIKLSKDLIIKLCSFASSKEIHSLLSEALTTKFIKVNKIANNNEITTNNNNTLLDLNFYEIVNNNELLTQLFLFQQFVNNLKRFPANDKRWHFLATLTRIGIQGFGMQIHQVDESHYDPEVMQYALERKIKSDRLFKECIKVFSNELFELSELISNINEMNKQIKQREINCILQFYFAMLAKIFSNQQLIELFDEEVNNIMKGIAKCKQTFNDLLEYFERYEKWNKKKNEHVNDEHNDDENMEELEEMEEEDEIEEDEKKNFIHWDYYGIGIFIYLILIKGIEKSKYNIFILSDHYIFLLSKTYIESMLHSGIPSISVIGLKLLKFILQNYLKKKYCIKLDFNTKQSNEMLKIYFDTCQALINFMTSCPNDKERTEAYRCFQEYISRFNDEGRYELLYFTLQKCPFPTMVAVVLDILKDEIILEYNAIFERMGKLQLEKLKEQNNYKPLIPNKNIEELNQQLKTNESISNNVITIPKLKYEKDQIEHIQLYAKDSKVFLQKHKIPNLLIELLTKYVDFPFDNDHSQVLVRGLNLFYFLLLRDSEPNVTGIMDKEIKDKLEEKILKVLREKIEKKEKYEQNNRSQELTTIKEENEEEDIDYETLLQEYGDEFSEDEREALMELQEQKENQIEKEQVGVQSQLNMFLLEEVLQRIDKILDK